MPFKPHFSWEFLEKDEIDRRTLTAINHHITALKKESEYYKTVLEGIDKIESLDEVDLIPITTPQELKIDIDMFRVVPFDTVRETIISTIPNGETITIPLTFSDLDRLAYNQSLALHAMDISSSDTVQILLNFNGMNLQAISTYRGVVALGANTLRVGELPPSDSIKMLREFRPNVLVASLNHFSDIGQYAAQEGIALSKFGIEKLICVNSPVYMDGLQLTDEAQMVANIFGSKIYSSVSIAEIGTHFCDCISQSGGHIYPELAYAEVIDPDNGNIVEDGVFGDLVITPLGIEGLPLIRYNTGIRASKNSSTCECGRNSSRISVLSYENDDLDEDRFIKAIAVNIENSEDHSPKEATLINDISEESTVEFDIEPVDDDDSSNRVDEVEIPITINDEPLDLNKIIRFFTDHDDVKGFFIEISTQTESSGERGDLLLIHTAILPPKVPKIREEFFEIYNILPMILVSNIPTINQMVESAQVDVPYIDRRK